MHADLQSVTRAAAVDGRRHTSAARLTRVGSLRAASPDLDDVGARHHTLESKRRGAFDGGFAPRRRCGLDVVVSSTCLQQHAERDQPDSHPGKRSVSCAARESQPRAKLPQHGMADWAHAGTPHDYTAASMTEVDELASVNAVAARLRQACAEPPTLCVVLGSGLGDVAKAIAIDATVDFADVPGMPRPRAPGHAGKFVFGTLEGARILCLVGRVHAYEGHSANEVVRGVRAVRKLGAEVFVLTNAAGGIRDDLEPGSLMAITDHLNLMGLDPGVGLGDGELGPRFPNLVDAWDPRLVSALQAAAKDAGIALTKGTYAAKLGPSYETPAEVRMVATCGGDAVGMSTVLEAIALVRMGARVSGISCITNRAAGRPGAVLDHHDVQANAARAAGGVQALVARLARGFAS